MRVEIIIASLFLAVAAYIDWKEHRVPNWLTFWAFGWGIAFHTLGSGMAGLWIALLGAVIGLATLIVPYALGGMGAGDVKLMAAVGAWVGAGATIQAFVWIAVFGGLLGAYSILRSRQIHARMRGVLFAGKDLFTLQTLETTSEGIPSKILLPYGVPIALGFYAYFLFGGLI